MAEPARRPGLGDVETAHRILDACFAEHAARNRWPSYAWGLVDHGQVVASGGTGVDAVYRIASMTKSFTAAAVLSLRDEGRLLLDDPIAVHAPELAPVGRVTTDAPEVTIRHLLTMSSGLATDDPWADRHMDVSDDELDGWLGPGTTSAAAPGLRFEYSNLGYGLLGRVVKRITGRPVQDLVSERFLGPLGMARTTWAPPADAVAGYHRRTRPGADGDDELVEVPFLADGSIAPMGGLFTTVADLATWVGFFTDAFPARDDPDDAPLCRASRREMQQVSRAFTDAIGGYGMGLNVLQHAKAGTVVTHSGGLPGYGSNMRWLPAQGMGLVLLANVTYAWAARATTDALDLLVEKGVVGPAPVAVSPAVAAAAGALAALHDSWSSSAAHELFADNVFMDREELVRSDAAAKLRAEHGPFTLARVVAESATSAVAVLHGPHAEVRVDFQLHPLVPSKVQTYEAKVVEG